MVCSGAGCAIRTEGMARAVDCEGGESRHEVWKEGHFPDFVALGGDGMG